MARPKINTSPVADQYADKTTERIVEFSSGQAGGPGGLISFKQTGEDGRGLHVDVYRLDEGVSVLVEGMTEPEGNITTAELLAWWAKLGLVQRRRPRVTRVARSFGDPGRWAAQYYDDHVGRWFDIGETHASEIQAGLAETAYLRDHVEG